MNGRAALIVALVATAMSSVALAGPWCPYTTCTTVQDCESKADWVVEGVVSDIVSQGKANTCWTRPGGGPPMCADIERPLRVLLERASVQKGGYGIDQTGHAELSPRSHCFSGPLGRPEPPMIRAQLEPTARGKRVRFYGFSKYTWEDLHPGYEIAVSVE